jgi:hypothetical protein
MEALQAQSGDEFGSRNERRRWWDYAIVIAATGLFVYLGVNAAMPPLAINLPWLGGLSAVLAMALGLGGWTLWRQTRFS